MMSTRLNVKSRKRIAGLLAFLIAAFIVGGVIGGIIVGAKMSISRNAETDGKEVQARSSVPYGTRDGKTLTPEGALIIESTDFCPARLRAACGIAGIHLLFMRGVLH